jgi:small GTP-binding protein
MEAALEHAQVAAGDRQKIAIVGPANVGKSTLYNQLIQSSEDKAAVSAVAGTTRRPQVGEGGLFMIVDTPGVDAYGSLGVEEKELALSAAQQADVLVLMFDGSHGIRDPEVGIYQEYRSLGKPMVVALNKMDLVGDERAKVTSNSAAALNLMVDEIIPMSAKKGWGIAPVLIAAAKVEPQIVAALGRALPAYRWDLTQARIGRAASTAAAIAITPLPFIHFIPLVGVQTALVLSIARIYDQRVTLARAKEIIAAFGLGFLGRSLFYELTKIGGPPAWAVSAAVAAGTTAALGYAVAVWFDQDRRISDRSLRDISKAISDSILGRLKRFGRRRPDEISLQDAITESLRKQKSDLDGLPAVETVD